MDAHWLFRSSRRGFTLVEMLAVIVIIAILASLITAAAIAARRKAAIAVINAEINQLDMACKAYKARFGDYPPDFTNATDLARHVRRAFPRYTGAPPAALTGSEALHYWLAGPDGKGWPANPRDPFTTPATSRIPPFFEFDAGRLRGHEYYPPRIPVPRSRPYVYFKAVNGAYDTNVQNCLGAVPVEDTRVGTAMLTGWSNTNSFQIQSAGLDGKYGVGQKFPDGSDYNDDRFDDQGNFCKQGTFGDEVP